MTTRSTASPSTSPTSPADPDRGTAAAPGTPVVLVPGYWLGAWAWDDVVPGLAAAGLVPHAVTLPGLEGRTAARAGLTLADHVAAVLDLVDRLEGDVVLVAHSGGAPVVQSVADRRVQRVRRVVYVDCGPLRPGVALYPDAATSGAVDVPFPTDEELEADGVSTEGIAPDQLAAVRARTVPQPAAVMGSPVDVGDARRLHLPVTVICTSLPSPVLQELARAGQMPTELLDHTDVEYVDLPTGHWPMFSRPRDLGDTIAAAVLRGA